MKDKYLVEIKKEIQSLSRGEIAISDHQILRLIDSFQELPEEKSPGQILEILEIEFDGLEVSTEGIDNSDLRTLLQAARPAK
ncbi:hypothetical protein [Xanthomonas arboricola]|uniref:hypothetical protein n=1 Tax=Xanthomonas arboricola TaxID=56448 RepID=UPI0011B0679E|nr:hypothetical protein [Xanthomonas arboricola]